MTKIKIIKLKNINFFNVRWQNVAWRSEWTFWFWFVCCFKFSFNRKNLKKLFLYFKFSFFEVTTTKWEEEFVCQVIMNAIWIIILFLFFLVRLGWAAWPWMKSLFSNKTKTKTKAKTKTNCKKKVNKEIIGEGERKQSY